ncbi:MAG: PTS sugar transporter subunit IIA [bacterium]
MHCLILSHGNVAISLVNAVKQILGECENLYAIDCADLSPQALFEKICRLIEMEKLRNGLFILVGLKGGSCWNVASRVVKEKPKIEVISGVNLPMVLAFVSKKDQYPLEEFGEVLVRDGMRGIARLTRSTL